MSAVDADILAFLREQIRERSEEELAHAFEPSFHPSDFIPTPSKVEWQEEVERLEKTAKEIDADPKCWPSVLEGLPSFAVQHFRDWPPASPTEAAEELRTLAGQSKVWHEHNPKTGGKDPAAYYLADTVKLAFEDLGLKVTFGTRDDGVTPSTCFGRIVQKALEYHGFDTDWRRPAEAAARGGS